MELIYAREGNTFALFEDDLIILSKEQISEIKNEIKTISLLN